MKINVKKQNEIYSQLFDCFRGIFLFFLLLFCFAFIKTCKCSSNHAEFPVQNDIFIKNHIFHVINCLLINVSVLHHLFSRYRFFSIFMQRDFFSWSFSKDTHKHLNRLCHNKLQIDLERQSGALANTKRRCA